jgi:hypothetical protein
LIHHHPPKSLATRTRKAQLVAVSISDVDLDDYWLSCALFMIVYV